MKKVKLLSLFAIGLLTVAGAVACGPEEGTDTPSTVFKVWAPVEHQDFYKEVFADFQKAHPEYAGYTLEYGTVSEGDAYGQVSKDVENAADVFTFANDQLLNLIRVGALAQVGGDYLDFVKENNDPMTVETSKDMKGDVYAYPMTLDNGYMLTYNKEVIPNYTEDMTFFDVAKACADANKKFVVPMGDSWYAFGFFRGFGSEYKVEYNADGVETKITCDYDGKEGLATGNFLIDLRDTAGFQYVDGGAAGQEPVKLNNYLDSHMSEIGAFISYPGAVKTYLLDKNDPWGSDSNIACDLLPMMDETHRMKTFIGMKMVGVNKTSDKLVMAHTFAQYITGKDVQLKRYESFNYGPSNIEAAATEKVANDVALKGLKKQFEENGEVQVNVPSTFWTALQNFTCSLGYKKEVNKNNLQTELTKLATNIETISQ